MSKTTREEHVAYLQEEVVKTWCLNGLASIATDQLGVMLAAYIIKHADDIDSEKVLTEDVIEAAQGVELGKDPEPLGRWAFRRSTLGSGHVSRLLGEDFWNVANLDVLTKRASRVINNSDGVLHGSIKIAFRFLEGDSDFIVVMNYLEKSIL